MPHHTVCSTSEKQLSLRACLRGRENWPLLTGEETEAYCGTVSPVRTEQSQALDANLYGSLFLRFSQHSPTPSGRQRQRSIFLSRLESLRWPLLITSFSHPFICPGLPFPTVAGTLQCQGHSNRSSPRELSGRGTDSKPNHLLRGDSEEACGGR